ncbi:MAG: CbtA family protein [Paracoccaceae bacterium]
MTKNLFTSALFAGLAAGLIAALLQFWLVIPLLLEGELYEIGLRAHFAVGHDTPVQSPSGPAGTLTQDISRHAMTLGFNVIAFTAFALIMVAGMAFAQRFGHNITARTGAIWGLAGYTAMHLAPAVGLPPELPGTIAAEVELRQIWFLATVAATALGLGLIAFGKNPVLIIIGIAALAMPHIVGAPQLDTYFGIAPPELASLFVTRSLGVAAVGWVTLGTVAGYFWARHSTT